MKRHLARFIPAVSHISKLDGHAIERLQVDDGAVEGKHKIDDPANQVGVGGAAGVHAGAQLDHALGQSPLQQRPDGGGYVGAHIPHALLEVCSKYRG